MNTQDHERDERDAEPRGHQGSEHTLLPWDAVEATEHHGPYITTAFGTTVCDLYVMTDPGNLFNGGKSVPASFTDADKNVHLIVRAVNSHADMLAALQACLARLTDYEGEWVVPLECEQMARAAIAKATGGAS